MGILSLLHPIGTVKNSLLVHTRIQMEIYRVRILDLYMCLISRQPESSKLRYQNLGYFQRMFEQEEACWVCFNMDLKCT